MARTLGELIALRDQVESMDAARARELLTEVLSDQMDTVYLIGKAQGNAEAVARVAALRDRLLSSKTWDGRDDLVSRAYGAEVASALTGAPITLTITAAEKNS